MAELRSDFNLFAGAENVRTKFVAETAIIDLSPEPVQAKVVREGYKVPTPALDDSRATFFIENLESTSLREEPRVVSQSVRPGTRVPRGTTIDLVLTPPTQIPIDIFERPHRALLGKNVHEITEGILQDAGVRQTILKYDKPDDVPEAEKAQLSKSFAESGIVLNEARPDENFDAAFNSMRGALAFR